MITPKSQYSGKKTQRISLFHAINQDRISDKVNKVAERVHLILLGFERRNSESKNSFLANLDGPHWPKQSALRPPPHQFCGSNQVCFADLGIFE